MDRSRASLTVLNLVHGYLEVDDCFNTMIKSKGYQLPILNKYTCTSILTNVIVECFAESNVLNSPCYTFSTIPLSELCLKLFQGYDRYKQTLRQEYEKLPIYACSFSMSDTPIVWAWIALRNEYHRLEDEVHKLDSTGSD